MRNSHYDQPIASVTIVGGGTAGAMAAAYIKRAISSDLDVNVVEPKRNEPIGVGEATLSQIKRVLQVIGVSEEELFLHANANFKQGIKFSNWNYGNNEYFYHPYDYGRPYERELSQYIVSNNEAANPEDFSKLACAQVDSCEENLSPKLRSSKEYRGVYSYAYHLDAILLGKLLKKKAISYGARYIEGTVETTSLRENGEIDYITLHGGLKIKSDLYIDCTGFSGKLIEKELGATKKPYPFLLANKAVTAQIPFPSRNALRKPYTEASARGAGWIWNIPLQSRIGAGYVYSSDHISAENAEKELRSFFDAPEETSCQHIYIFTGRRDDIWFKNCVAIGLSSGFIEPLESTGIHLIQAGIENLIDCWPGKNSMELLGRHYNRLMTNIYDETAEFIHAHYFLSRRRDTQFWKDVTNEKLLSSSLKYKLELWKYKYPKMEDLLVINSVFNASSWLYILAGFGEIKNMRLARTIDPLTASNFKKNIKLRDRSINSRLITNNHYLDSFQSI